MTLQEIQEKFPGTQVVEFDPNAKYLILCDDKLVSVEGMKILAKMCDNNQIHAMILSGREPGRAMRIYQFLET